VTKKRITKLTAEQEAYLPIYREEVRAKALRGQWATDDQMREAVRALYVARGRKEPVVLVFSNPVLCLMARGLLRRRDQLGDQLWDQLWDQLRDQLWGQLGDQLRDQLWDQLRDQLWDQLRDQLGGQLRGQLGDQLGDQLWDQLWGQLGGQLGGQLWGQLRDQLGDQLGGQLGDQLRDQLWDQLRDQLWDQLRDQLGGQLRGQLGGQLGDQLGGQLGGQLWDQLRDQLGGQLWDQLRDQLWDQLGDQLRGQLGDHDLWQALWFAGGSEAYWISFYAYGHHIGAKYNEATGAGLRAWERYAEVCGPLYPYDGIAFVSHRPETHFDAERRLHCETGPAICFDGYGVYAWHGVRVPAEWIEDKATPTPEKAITWPNVEQRRAAIEILGWQKILPALNARTIDVDDNPYVGEVLAVDLPGLDGGPVIPARFLKALCGTGRIICEAFPPDIPTDPNFSLAHAAQAWRVGKPVREWCAPTIRT